MSTRAISLALTHFNRFDFLLKCVSKVLGDPRIGEICISDDCSTDGACLRLASHFRDNAKVHIYSNATNLDCYRNKHAAVQHATCDWVILFDDDNILPTEYLDALFAIDLWDSKTAYCPVEARPHFDYRAFSGLTVDRTNVAGFMARKHFSTALNTANYFFNRAEWLRVFDASLNPHTADSLFQNFNWLRGGNRIHFVPDMWYMHRVHEGSHFKRENHKTGALAGQIIEQLKAMR